MQDPEESVVTWAIRRCRAEDWRDIRRLHVMMALGIPLAVDVELNDVFATPDAYWTEYTTACALGGEQALYVADGARACVGMGHVRLDHGEGRLAMLFVEENHRRRGVGSALFVAQESWARDSGGDPLGLSHTGHECRGPARRAIRLDVYRGDLRGQEQARRAPLGQDDLLAPRRAPQCPDGSDPVHDAAAGTRPRGRHRSR